MGWLWTSSPKEAPKLDKDLQDFLDGELSHSKGSSPKSSATRASPSPSSSVVPSPPRSEPNVASTKQPAPSAATPTSTTAPPPTVPPQSAFQDGRYSHLWKTYRPVAEVEAEAEDHSARLRSLSQVHKTREARIEDAAKENCVMEAEALLNCYKGGKPADLLTMCMTATREKSSCIEMQMRFLRALGYMATPGQTEDVQDRLQIHADLMYRRMREQEREVEAAIAEGRPVPEIKPVMSRENVAAVLRTIPIDKREQTRSHSSSAFDSGVGLSPNGGAVVETPSFEEILKLDPKQAAEYRNAIKDKSPEQIALIQRELEGESIYRLAGTRQINSYLDVERRERAERTAAGKQRFGDYILNWWGFNSGPRDGN